MIAPPLGVMQVFPHLVISDLTEALEAMGEVNTLYRDDEIDNGNDNHIGQDSEQRSTFLNAIRGLRMVNVTENSAALNE